MGLFSKKKPKISKQELQFQQQNAANSLRIIQDSAKLVAETKKPDVFFSRYNLLLQHSQTLVDLDGIVNFSGASPQAAMQEALNNKQQAIHQFLVRYWSDVLQKADSLKTEAAKKKQYQQFYDSLNEYQSEMDAANQEFYVTKYNAYAT